MSIAIPTPCLQDKLAATGGTQQLLRPDLRAKYERALLSRIEQEETLPKKRSVSATERFNQAHWIVGCHSYGTLVSLGLVIAEHSTANRFVISLIAAISDNKEYVAKLAIDSHLSEEIPLDQIF